MSQTVDPLGELPNTFGNLGKLEALHLSGNPLMTFPSSILRCSNLKHLDLSRCRLSKVVRPETPTIKILSTPQLQTCR